MAGQLSSVNLIATAGILGNIGGVPIAANADVVSNIAAYNNLAVITQFANVKLTANALLSSNVMTSLNNLAANIFPALTNAVPSDYIGNLGNTPVNGFTSVVSNNINSIMGNGDLGIFDQVLSLSDAYVFSTNMMIISSKNANNESASLTYISQDNTITGGISQITQAFSDFGDDLIALGTSIDLARLPNLGSPQALLRQIYYQTGGTSELTNALVNAGIDQTILNNIGDIELTDQQQKIIYEVMTQITRGALIQVLRLLRVTTRGLTNLADLLNPVKMFPRSFNTLTAPTANGLRGIYINSSGAVNTNLETELPANVLAPLQGYNSVKNTYVQLKNIIPPDQALANKALQAGLEQVKSIFSSNLPALGIAVKDLESNKGLNIINALTSPLPADVSNYFATTLATGTGTDGTILLADVIGSAGGWVVAANVSTAQSQISSLSNSGALTTLTNGSNGVFTVMQNALEGDYGIPDGSGNVMIIPGGLPGAGTYGTYDLAFTGPGTPSGVGLIPAAYTLINTIITNNSSNVAIANVAWSNVAAQIFLEQTLQADADIVYANLVPGTKAVGLTNNLNQYGLQTSIGGAAWFMESVANTSTQGGQAVISSLREARNQVRLTQASLQTDIIVNDQIVEPQISYSSGQYTEAEAASQKII